MMALCGARSHNGDCVNWREEAAHGAYRPVTAACMAVRRTVFEEADGFDETLSVAYNDVDLCLRIGARGYRNVWTPFAELYHYESVSQGDDRTNDRAGSGPNRSSCMSDGASCCRRTRTSIPTCRWIRPISRSPPHRVIAACGESLS